MKKNDAFKSYSSICAENTWSHEKCLHFHINMHFIYQTTTKCKLTQFSIKCCAIQPHITNVLQ